MTRERYLEKMATKIASYVYATAVLESGDANWCIFFDEIEERFGVQDEEHTEGYYMLKSRLIDDDELVEMVKEELHKYGGLADDDECVIVDKTYGCGCFDINLWHDYRATYTDLDEEEDMEEDEDE